MTSALAAVVAGSVLLPHLLRLERAPPATAIAVWLSALALRALLAVLAVVLLLFFLPRAEPFMAITHWCLDVVVPVEGHAIGDALLYAPGVLLAASLLLACVRTAREARAARHIVAAHAVGVGPGQSLVVGGHEVLFAVAGLARPRVLVSAGALARLDDQELEAALDHERAHIARRHRFLMLAGVTCRALGRPVPGANRSLDALAFHLERDADRWALRRRNDRLALASVICKAAADRPPASGATVSALGGTGVRERLGQLLEEPSAGRPRWTAAALNGLAAAMVAGTLLLAAAVPAAAVAGAGGDAHRAHHGHHCHH